METIKIKEFLAARSGYGYGYGYGSGYGTGYGASSGYGPGYGSGDGYGHGSGIKKYDGEDVHMIDGVQTIITAVHGNIAKGNILQGDLTLTPCFVAKVDGFFAHGETARAAVESARDKAFEDMPQEKRIAAFLDEIKPNTAYPVMTLYDWHHRLTGSCEAGRKAFAKDHGIDLSADMTREAFFELTKGAYGGNVIREAMRIAEREKDGE